MFEIRQSASFDSKSRGFVDPADVLYSKCNGIFLITETGAARAMKTWRYQGFHERCANQSNKCKSVFM